MSSTERVERLLERLVGTFQERTDGTIEHGIGRKPAPLLAIFWNGNLERNPNRSTPPFHHPPRGGTVERWARFAMDEGRPDRRRAASRWRGGDPLHCQGLT
ncbi:MAG: hypothetical protein ACK51Z_03095 [Pseudomonadota bacterium]